MNQPEKKCNQILNYLKDRKGFDSWWSDIEDFHEEIVKDLTEIIGGESVVLTPPAQEEKNHVCVICKQAINEQVCREKPLKCCVCNNHGCQPPQEAQEEKQNCPCLEPNAAIIPNLHKTDCERDLPPQEKEPEIDAMAIAKKDSDWPKFSFQAKDRLQRELAKDPVYQDYIQKEPETPHYSDCEVYNEPALPKGECNCRANKEWKKDFIHELEYYLENKEDCSTKDVIEIMTKVVGKQICSARTEAETRGWNEAIDEVLKIVPERMKKDMIYPEVFFPIVESMKKKV